MKAPERTLALVRTMANRGEVIDPFGYVGTTVAGTEVHSSLTNVLSHMPLKKIERTLDGQRILLWEDSGQMSCGIESKARSWTGRACAEDHDCYTSATHRAEDGTRWRGNADVVQPDAPLPAGLRVAFLAMVECCAKGNEEAREEWEFWRGMAFDMLSVACGVVWVEDDAATEAYWVGPWPTNYHEWYVKEPRTADEICRFRMWRSEERSWGCAL